LQGASCNRILLPAANHRRSENPKDFHALSTAYCPRLFPPIVSAGLFGHHFLYGLPIPGALRACHNFEGTDYALENRKPATGAGFFKESVDV
jgi:hypothetical protein